MRAARFPQVLGVILLIVVLAGCGGGGGEAVAPPSPAPPATPAFTPTTTLAAETGNNTSAADSFVAQTNGNGNAGNVSKVAIRSLLYTGSTTKVFAHLVAWFGGSGHMNVGYRSDDPAQVHRQVEDMISRGIQGAIIDWYGAGNSTVNNASMLVKKEAEAHAGQFEFAIMEDGGALFEAAVANHCDVTDQLLSDLNYIATQFETSSAYLQINGRPVVFFFGVDTYYVDWSRVAASAANHPLLIFQGRDGLQRTISDGAFQWVDIDSSNPFDPELAPQGAFYSAAATSSRVSFGSAYKGFNDTLAIWGTNRFIYQGCGATWLATFNEVSKFYSAGHQLPGLQLVTWNDYEEGTAIESGVDNCMYLTPSIGGATLSWAVAGGDESTVDHYTVFISTDGQNLAKLADVPSGTHSFDLAQLNLTRGTYVLLVKAVGRASFQNKMSAAISYHPGDQPPTASLAVTQTDVLTVHASSEASSDPDGSVASSTLDFGDGTVAKGPAASHTYAVPGTYNITATVFDNSGSSAVAVTRTSVKPATPGVTIFAPTNGATVNWPTSLIASATLANPVTMMEVMIDGQLVYRIDRDAINAALKVFRGTHQVQIQAFDSTGAVATSSVTVTAEPGDLTPTANVSVLPMPAISPNTVLVCTANSNDPDGFFIARKMQFSDGTTTYGTAAVHTFAAPGSYSVTATVTDQFGAPASASATFAVGH